MSVAVLLRKFGKPAVLLGCTLLASVAVFWLVTGAFIIETVEVVGEGVVLTMERNKLPKNLLLLSTEKLARGLREAYPLLWAITVTKRYPHTLVISATVRKPLAQITTPLGTFIVDVEGVVLGEKTSTGQFPRLNFSVPVVAVGTRIPDPAVASSLQLVANTGSFIDIAEISTNDSSSILAKTVTTDIIIPQGGDIGAIVTTLQTLFSGFRIKGTLPTRVDLRFDKPVVTF